MCRDLEASSEDHYMALREGTDLSEWGIRSESLWIRDQSSGRGKQCSATPGPQRRQAETVKCEAGSGSSSRGSECQGQPHETHSTGDGKEKRQASRRQALLSLSSASMEHSLSRFRSHPLFAASALLSYEHQMFSGRKTAVLLQTNSQLINIAKITLLSGAT